MNNNREIRVALWVIVVCLAAMVRELPGPEHNAHQIAGLLIGCAAGARVGSLFRDWLDQRKADRNARRAT